MIDDGEMAINDTLNLKVKITPTANQSNAENAKWTITSGSRYVEYTSNNVNEDDSTIAKGEMVTLKAKKAGIFSVKVELGGKSDEITMTIGKRIKLRHYHQRDSHQNAQSNGFVPAQLTKLLQQMNSNDLYNSIPARRLTLAETTLFRFRLSGMTRRSSSKKSATVSGLR